MPLASLSTKLFVLQETLRKAARARADVADIIGQTGGCERRRAVPANMDCVLRVNTDRICDDDSVMSSSYLRIDYVGEGCFQEVDDKWQGGFVGQDGRIYAIPENSERVMVITPGDMPSVELL
jgi:hypothetical protein